jgi:alkyl hydroperoxide reductase subunit AhpF
MAMISAENASKVEAFFRDHLQEPVLIDLFTEKKSPLIVPGRRDCEYCEETEQLLGEVAALSEHIRLQVHDVRGDSEAANTFGIEPGMIPAYVLRGGARGKARFFGIPAGYEFSSLLQDLVDVSKGETSLSAASKASLQELSGDVHIRVFVTPT